MNPIAAYLISVISAALISAIAVQITGQKGTVSAVTKLICRLFLIITVISPLRKIQLGDLTGYFSDITASADRIVYEGETIAQEEMTAIIKARLETYILDKASSLNLNTDIDITVSESQPHIPISVIVSGNVSPYGKQRLEQILVDDLGIAKENISWS